jgi:superkiller protein 3
MSLCIRDYEAALEGFDSVVGLLPENDPQNDENNLPTIIIRVQAHLGSGLANFHLGNLDEALIGFEAALEAARDHRVIKGQIVVLLAQTLWAIDTEESRESAKSRLLERCVTPITLSALGSI